MTDVFISYSRKDSEFMRYLHGELSKQDRDVWVDWEDIPATADWWDEIKTAIEAADTFAFIISPNSVRSDICHDEIQHAIDNNKRFIPILYKEISDLDAPYIHSAIRSHNWIPFADESQYEAGMKKLLDSLSTEPDYVRRHTRLLVRAKEWELHERDRSYLLVGRELNEFLNWIESSQTRTPKPTEIQLEYVYASQRRRNRRNLRIAAGTVAGIILFIVLVSAYLVQQQQFEAQQTAQAVALEGTSAVQDALLTQAKIELESNQTQVRENSFALLTQSALEVENADLRATITAFANTGTPSSNTTVIVVTATQETLIDASPTQEGISETVPTQVMMTATSEAGAQQVMTTMPSPPPPSQEVEEGKLFVSREGNDNNDCHSFREGSCKTIKAALEKAEAGDLIEVAPGVYNENLVITKDIVITGFDPESSVISGNFAGTVIVIEAGVQVELYDLTITGGESPTYGGGIINNGILYMEHVTIEANSAELTGGGLANLGELEAKDVEIVQNYAASHHDFYTYPLAWAELDDVEYDEDNHNPLDLPQSASEDFLIVNMLVRIDTTDNEHLNLRDKPGLKERIVKQIENGTLAIITKGSEERDGFTWWELRLETGEIGWAADFVDNVETIVPFNEYVGANGV